MPSLIVRLRGLPFTATESQIIEFLGNPQNPQIHFVQKSSGRKTGDAFVTVQTEEEYKACIDRHRQFMDMRYVEVYGSNEQEMISIGKLYFTRVLSDPNGTGDPLGTDQQRKRHSVASTSEDGMLLETAYEINEVSNVQPGFVLRMRGLPFNATSDTILDFFSDPAPLNIVSISFRYNSDNRPSGVAFVEFASDEDLRRGLTKDKARIGNRYIELFESSMTEKLRSVRFRNDSRIFTHQRALPPTMMPPHMTKSSINKFQATTVGKQSSGTLPSTVEASKNDHVIRVRGLPFNASELSVAHFLEGISIVPRGIHLVFNGEDKFTGEAFVEVLSVDDVTLAIQRHMKRMAHRYVEVFSSSREEMLAKGYPYEAPLRTWDATPKIYGTSQIYGDAREAHVYHASPITHGQLVMMSGVVQAPLPQGGVQMIPAMLHPVTQAVPINLTK